MTDSTPPIPPEDSPQHVEPPPERPVSEPLLNMPPILVSVILFMAALYAVQVLLLPEETAAQLDFYFGFLPARYDYPLFDGDFSWAWTPVTYSFLHGSVEHLVFNCLWLASFGTPVVRRIGAARAALLWVLSAIASAAFFAALHLHEIQLVIGASGVISAYMGAACRFAFPPRQVNFSRRPVHLYPGLTLRGVLASRTALSFLGLWLFGNLLVAFGLPIAGGPSGAIAWEAHIGGLLFGFFAFPLFDRQRRHPTLPASQTP